MTLGCIAVLPPTINYRDREPVGETTPTDPRAQRNQAPRRGGHLTTRAGSPPHNTGLPTLLHSQHPCPDGRTVCRPTPRRKRSGPTRPTTLGLSYRLTIPSNPIMDGSGPE